MEKKRIPDAQRACSRRAATTCVLMTVHARLGSIALMVLAVPSALAVACSSATTMLPGDDFGSGTTGGSAPTAGAFARAGASSSATGGSVGMSSGGSGAATGGTGAATGGTGMVGAGGSSALGGSSGLGAGGSAGHVTASAGTFGSGGSKAFGGAGTASNVGGSGTSFGAGRGGSTGLGGRSSGTGGSAGARGGATGAAGAGVGGSGSSVAFSQVGAILQAQCGTSSCHGGKQSPNLTNTNLSTLYTTLTSTTVRQCGSDHLVTKNDTANSALLELPQGTCTNFIMPRGCTSTPCLKSADMTTITNWILAGAPGP